MHRIWEERLNLYGTPVLSDMETLQKQLKRLEREKSQFVSTRFMALSHCHLQTREEAERGAVVVDYAG